MKRGTRSGRGLPGVVVVVVCVLAGRATARTVDVRQQLAAELTPWMECWRDPATPCRVAGSVRWGEGDALPPVTFSFTRYDEQSFDLSVEHPEYALEIRRRADETALILPRHRQVFRGSGACDPVDCLTARDCTRRLISPGSAASGYLPLLAAANPQFLATALSALVEIRRTADDAGWEVGELRWQSSDEGRRLRGSWSGGSVELEVSTDASGEAPAIAAPADFATTELEREELERQLARGFRRSLEILAPGPQLTKPAESPRQTAHGRLQWIDGHRVVLLSGTPEQIGKAHGELLREESYRCLDSVLYAFGTVQTVRTGRWFRHELEAAYERLAPHIPERHKAETRALAASLDADADLLEAVNVFPELFHCSGFALFGSATADGKLYHGRVLDYMTMIGLQDAAATFIVAPEGRIPFANVGYAAFIGSVSGMNAEQISLGEMGGRGEGRWDGAPMATLMRRALEECDSLDAVKQLWRSSPRTCEYYYVFADGEQKSAVGVAATPEAVQFVEPGAGHPLLGEGIPDAVVLSAGDRLEKLRARVLAGHGTIDVAAAQALMCRPVAMRSNLHNVLFVPEDGVLYVAHADHQAPAAERPYVRIDLAGLLPELQRLSAPVAEAPPAPSLPSAWTSRDSLAPADEPLDDAQACLEGLVWTPDAFPVRLEAAPEGQGEWLVRFPSPRPSGDPVNDLVALEWHAVRDAAGNPRRAPAAVVVHESGRGMTVGRLIAKGLRSQGVHAFMIHLPSYGARRGDRRPDHADQLAAAMQQGIADARRARDAIAPLAVVDSERISLQGTSLGGFVAATVAGLDRGYDQVFVLLAGGDLYGVVMQGKRDAENVRKDLAQAGLDDAKVRQMLASIEPLRLAHRIDPNGLWLYSGRFDDVVPPRHADLLAKAAGIDDQRHYRMFADHYSGIVYLPYVLQQMSQQISAP
jgi:dienelactone hydrolase